MIICGNGKQYAYTQGNESRENRENYTETGCSDLFLTFENPFIV